MEVVPIALNRVPLSQIKAFARKSYRYMDVYRVYIRPSEYPIFALSVYPDIQLIYPDLIQIIWILPGYPKLSGYPIIFAD
uniref:Uncharacterized protein n=1 Tax=Rhizophagus irregularis (strain DAOM 181602 / DAOM 197198 / MUCL 43194) TaxID=747089 RepID=U9TL28_RHIID